MLENYFNYKKHKTNFKTEVIAGITTFLTMAYIMFLNPFILSGEFADIGYVLVSGQTAIAGKGDDLLNNPDVGRLFLGG